MEDVNDFLSILRTDRSREISKCKKKNYIVDKYYRMVRKMYFEHDDKSIEMGVQVSATDFFFYLIDDEENAYYSIREIYDLLHSMSKVEGEKYVTELLTQQCNAKEKEKFKYEEIEYEIRKSIVPDKTGEIVVYDGSKPVSYEMLFVLINVVQEKSNALFKRKKGNEAYINGIIHLLIAMLSIDNDNMILGEKGWFWDDETKKFIYKDILEKDEKVIKKYYLTKGEFDAIMSIES